MTSDWEFGFSKQYFTTAFPEEVGRGIQFWYLRLNTRLPSKNPIDIIFIFPICVGVEQHVFCHTSLSDVISVFSSISSLAQQTSVRLSNLNSTCTSFSVGQKINCFRGFNLILVSRRPRLAADRPLLPNHYPSLMSVNVTPRSFIDNKNPNHRCIRSKI